MSGSRDAFVNIDSGIRGSVRFGDGSEVEIEGAGTVLFEGKTGEHLPLMGVYFIPRLTTNIVSLGQLDVTSTPSTVSSESMTKRGG